MSEGREQAAASAENGGIYLSADPVLCEDCGFIGIALDGKDCRKCAGKSISRLMLIVGAGRVTSAHAQKGGNLG